MMKLLDVVQSVLALVLFAIALHAPEKGRVAKTVSSASVGVVALLMLAILVRRRRSTS